jgi:hypothetical protein
MKDAFDLNHDELMNAANNAEKHLAKYYGNQPKDCIDSAFEDNRFIEFLGGNPENQREISRPGYKSVSPKEAELDKLDWFNKKRDYYLSEFKHDWFDSGLDQTKLDRFICGIKNGLYDGRIERESHPDALAIKKSVWDYLKNKGALPLGVTEPASEPLLSINEMSDLLRINSKLVKVMFDDWLSQTGQTKKSTNDIVFRRGVHLAKPINLANYNEKELIVSYSLAITVAEQFAQIVSDKTPHIIRMEYNACSEDILYTSLLIESAKAEIEQFEFGVLPAQSNRCLKKIGTYMGMEEFKIEWEGIWKSF